MSEHQCMPIIARKCIFLQLDVSNEFNLTYTTVTQTFLQSEHAWYWVHTFIQVFFQSSRLFLITHILTFPGYNEDYSLLCFHQNQCRANALKIQKSWIVKWSPQSFQLSRKIHLRHKDFTQKTKYQSSKIREHLVMPLGWRS